MNVFSQLVRSLPHGYTPETLRRAEHYTRNGSVTTPDLQDLRPDRVEATSRVRGSDPAPYVVHLVAEDTGHGVDVQTSCSCPVRYQCKHGAALAMVLGRTLGAGLGSPPAAPAPEPGTGWRTAAEELIDDLDELAAPAEDRPGVALQVSLELVRSRSGSEPRGTRLRVRPLRPGARQAWVKGGLGWSDVPRAVVERAYDATQLRALERLHQALATRGGYWYGAEADANVEDFGPGVVPLLAEAVASGVTVVPTHPLTSVRFETERVAVSADAATADDGSVLVTLGVALDDGWWSGSDLATLGNPAHSVVLGETDLVLAALERPLSGGPLRALRRPTPVAVPAGEQTEADDFLRRLGAVVELGSRDGSVALPERLQPRLRVTVTWRSSDEAEVLWAFVYADRRGDESDGADGADAADTTGSPVEVVVPLEGGASHAGLRDRDAERRLLDGVQPRPERTRAVVTGVDALHLGVLELPAWRLVEGLDVVEVDAPDFREADEAPVISFDAPGGTDGADADGTDGTDWLDLWVTITVEGEPVPLAQVLAALTRGDEHLVLPSGLFVRLDDPTFAALDDVVRSAAQLHERPDDDQIRVGAQDLGTWAQVADLGPVDARSDPRADAWIERARALRDLVALPRPDPQGVVSTLRDYQLDGFHWLAFLWEHDLGGILADEMGLGKTLQVLTLVAHARAHEPDRPPFLVVAPTSVVGAWASEAARHTPDLRVRTVTSTDARRGESLASIAADADVVVTTYTLLRLEVDAYAALPWAGLVLDEAQWIKNHRSKAWAAVRAIDTSFHLAVTGTPFENRLLELWSLLSIVAPGLYPTAQGFTSHVVTPVEKGRDEAALRRFTRRVRPFVLRRSKELVAAELPPKQEQVLEVELSPAHRRIYDAHLAKERQRILGLVEDYDTHRVAILAALTRLRQLALDPALVDRDHDRVGSAKIDLLVEQLREITAEGHRALVFSQFTGFLARVRDRLARESIPTTTLDGSTRDRAAVVQAFREGGAPVFLISLKAGGVGLTLTEADYVFVLDPWWNPAAEAQAVDRAHRIGQERTVMVYRLVSADTIEDKVMALKARKAALFSQVLDGEAGMSDAITADDIRALFD